MEVSGDEKPPAIEGKYKTSSYAAILGKVSPLENYMKFMSSASLQKMFSVQRGQTIVPCLGAPSNGDHSSQL